jgi:CheY-like chemotaxis protein
VVDDNAHAREILSHMLKPYSIEVDMVSSGALALEALETRGDTPPYDLVFMDWKMPELDGLQTLAKISQIAELPAVPAVVMVTAFGRDELIQAAGLLPLAAVLTKPINQYALMNAMSQALGQSPVVMTQSNLHAVETQQAIKKLQGAYLLLVEDNDLNQELAVDLLTSNGIQVDVANNGIEAISAIEKATYDGVLMDVQMPGMDGLTATKILRQKFDHAVLPIIAMTANVMSEDLQRVKTSGMDEHIAKPVNIRDMMTTMAKWITPSHPTEYHQHTQQMGSSTDCPDIYGIDVKTGLSIAQGNRELYFKLLSKYLQGQTGFIDTFKQALTDDLGLAERMVHTLKGVSGNIGATPIQETAAAIEFTLAEQEIISDALLFTLERQLNTTLSSLNQWKRSNKKTIEDNIIIDDPVALEAQLNTLRQLLEDDDTEATDLIDELMPKMAKNNRAHLTALNQCIGQYDFEQALRLLDKIENKT